jgi:hypothetical protein
MGSQPFFYNGCTDTVICESIIFDEPNTAYCFISAVSKIGGYKNPISWWIFILAV